MLVTARVVVMLVLACLSGAAVLAQEPSTGPAAQARAPGPRGDVLTEYHLPPDTLAKSEALYRTAVVMLVVGTVC